MIEYIVKFKKELKNYQQVTKQLIKKYEKELSIVQRALDGDITLADEIEITGESFMKHTPTFQRIYYFYLETKSQKNKWKFWKKSKKVSEKDVIEEIKEAKEKFKEFISYCKTQYSMTQNIINHLRMIKSKNL